MKTMSVLTDFSANAVNAVKSAATIVEKPRTDTLFYNSSYDHPIFPLNRQCKESGGEILALVFYQHGFLVNIFPKKHNRRSHI